ncbi:DUF3289 family protein [Candidatus Pantoea multigeneris]|uniref:DUF3289 family protein n=1 Tax=Candidatus Pantoea multigeneris TaxID=2608357 RepID=A0ABX0RDT4_9GAMM|nr:DUF3289 family protein [Pantoea multigeneris]NIF22909.1 DUF3289 family protein [Pantoea multigeneris]
MSIAVFPQTVFTSHRPFNHYGADDMQYGDLSESALKNEFRLTHISDVVDPFTLTRVLPFSTPQNRFAGVYGAHHGQPLTREKAAQLLFEEMQVKCWPYSMVGPYRHLINRMLEHMMKGTGSPFSHVLLDQAYREKILKSNEALINIKKALNDNIDFQNKFYPANKIPEITSYIKKGILPKFNSLFLDKINGLGITIHDVNSTKIEIIQLDIRDKNWSAKIKFTGQDHFGLDLEDIKKERFRQFQFFKIWFILQRYDRFGFRPFMTNMSASVDIQGSGS